MVFDKTISVRDLVVEYNWYLSEEIKLRWALSRNPVAHHKVHEFGVEPRDISNPEELESFKEGAFQTRKKIANILYKTQDPEIMQLAKRMGQVAKAKCYGINKADKEELLKRVHSLSVDMYLEVE